MDDLTTFLNSLELDIQKLPAKYRELIIHQIQEIRTGSYGQEALQHRLGVIENMRRIFHNQIAATKFEKQKWRGYPQI